MLTAFHTTKRNPKSKALNAVLESVWVMPPSIMHHNEVSEKGDEAENHPSAFRASTLCLVWSVPAQDGEGWELPFPRASSAPLPPCHCPCSLLLCLSFRMQPYSHPCSELSRTSISCCCSGSCTKKHKILHKKAQNTPLYYRKVQLSAVWLPALLLIIP